MGEELHRYGVRLFETGFTTDALRVLGDALREHETSERWNDWATAAMACRLFKEAENGYRRALQLEPICDEASDNLRELLRLAGRTAAAETQSGGPSSIVCEQQPPAAPPTMCQPPQPVLAQDSRLQPAVMPFAGWPRRKLHEMASQHEWVHVIDLGDGVVTPGAWGTGNPRITEAMQAVDFSGKKVLDIGCWDGAYSFFAEARGAAEVYSTDLISQRDFAGSPTYQIAHAACQSKAKYYLNISVYDIEKLGIRDFDIVLFTGIYYHLKDPVRALTCLRRVMREGGLIVVEGAVLPGEGCYASFYYRNLPTPDRSNWWFPTVECLRQWVECSFFDIVQHYEIWGLHMEIPRQALLAKAVLRDDPLYSRVPEELEEYCLRKY